jgi:ABC-type lipoprotein release transport system permease subunit
MLLSLLALSARNLMRNRRRTVITAAAMGLGLASLLFMDGLMTSWLDQMVATTTESWTGHAQIHREGYRETGRQSLVVENPRLVEETLSASPDVTAWTRRLISPATIQSAMDLKPVALYGVEPLSEAEISLLDEAVEEGEYLDEDTFGLLLGFKLAETMDLMVGDPVVLTASEAGGGLGQGLFMVRGIVRFGMEDLDGYSVFIHCRAAEELLELPGQAHQYALALGDPDDVLARWDALRAPLSTPGNTVENFAEISAFFTSMLEMMDVAMGVMTLILLGLVAFGIVNTLYMSVFERTWEYGVLLALGTDRRFVRRGVMMETALLAVMGVLFGVLLGTGVNLFFTRVGIDFTGFDMGGVALSTRTYTQFRLEQFVLYPSVMVFFTLIAGIWPALRASRIVPARALRNRQV